MALVGLRRAIRLRLAVERADEIRRNGPVHIIRDEQIEMPIAVVVEPRGRCREPGRADARACGHVHERAAARVVEQTVAVQAGDVQIRTPVVVVVGRRDAEPVHLDSEARRRRDVGERAVVVVAVQGVARRCALVAGPARRVDEEEILESVAVGVEERDARAHCLRQVLLAERAARVPEADAGSGRDIGEDGRRGARGPPRAGRMAGEHGARSGDDDEDAAHQRRGSSAAAERCSWMACRSLLSSGCRLRYGPVIACDDSSALKRT